MPQERMNDNHLNLVIVMTLVVISLSLLDENWRTSDTLERCGVTRNHLCKDIGQLRA